MNKIQASNPFFEIYSTPHGTVPFNLIKTEHYAPAIHEGIRRQNGEIDAIINNPDAPTFENTIVPYEKSGELLHRVNTVFGNLLSAETASTKSCLPASKPYMSWLTRQNLPRNNPNYWKIFIPASYVTGQTCKETPKNSTATYARN